jgi:arylsulfatase A-like enzyme
MNRRDLLRLSGLPLAAALGRGQRPAPAVQPNFIFIMADDLGVYDLGCYGQKMIRTPNIDRLAEQGMRFTDCYAGASVCAPSRSVLMTGQHTGHTTVRSNMSLRTGRRVSLMEDDVTVAQLLKGPEWRDAYDEKRGYATAIFGKWGLGEPGTPGLPNDHGFDEWFGFLNQQHAHGHYPDFLWRNKTREVLKGNLGGSRREYASDLFAREALYFIDRHRYEPFFLYFTPTVPHAKFEAPDLGPYAGQSWPEAAKNYAAMVTRMDSYVGSILAKLKETGLEENTVVFFASDNGGMFNGPFGTMGPLRERKGSIYEGGTRIPMIVRWPGKVKAGSVSDYPWAFWDVLPTLADLAGARNIPRNVDGISVAPTLLGKPQDPERPLYWESYGGRGNFQQAVRMGRWKGVRHGLEEPLELYDLSSDVGETKNVAASQTGVVRSMEAFLRDCRTESPEYPSERRSS